MKHKILITSCLSALMAFQNYHSIGKYNDILLDLGYGWKKNTLDKSEIVWDDSDIGSQLLKKYILPPSSFQNKYFIKEAGLLVNINNSTKPRLSNLNRYDKVDYFFSPYVLLTNQYENWDLKVFIRGVNNKKGMVGYTGTERDISRFGLKSAEINKSTISYKTRHLLVDYGRNNIVWGSSFKNNIILSNLSPSFERIKINRTFQNFNFSFFYGFLESVTHMGQINNMRYLTGKFFEYTNKADFIISVGEIITLYGQDRAIDFSYLNPLSFHLENEQNDKTNQSLGNTENAIWFVYIDKFFKKSFRLCFELLVDEFQIDSEDRQVGRGDAIGLKVHTALNQKFNDRIFIFNLDYSKIGTFTYQHQSGLGNFVNKNYFIGNSLGNDMDQLSVKLSLLSSNSLFSFSFSQIRLGENNLFNNYYKNFEEIYKTSFPSGKVFYENIIELDANFTGWKYLDFLFKVQYFSSSNYSNYMNFAFKQIYYLN